MQDNSTGDLSRIWKQNEIPVVVRKGEGYKLRVKLPSRSPKLDPHKGFKEWQRACFFLRAVRPSGHQPKWLQRYGGWEVPAGWFNDLVNFLLSHFAKVYIIQPYREQEKCAYQCMNAQGHECECSCMGANHGAGGPGAGWYEVSDTFATRWGESYLACRLVTRVSRPLILPPPSSAY